MDFECLQKFLQQTAFKILFRYTTKEALKEIVDSRGETLYVNTDCQGRVEKIFRRANSKDIPLVGYHYDSSGNMISTEDSFGTRKFFLLCRSPAGQAHQPVRYELSLGIRW